MTPKNLTEKEEQMAHKIYTNLSQVFRGEILFFREDHHLSLLREISKSLLAKNDAMLFNEASTERKASNVDKLTRYERIRERVLYNELNRAKQNKVFNEINKEKRKIHINEVVQENMWQYIVKCGFDIYKIAIVQLMYKACTNVSSENY